MQRNFLRGGVLFCLRTSADGVVVCGDCNFPNHYIAPCGTVRAIIQKKLRVPFVFARARRRFQFYIFACTPRRLSADHTSEPARDKTKT